MWTLASSTCNPFDTSRSHATWSGLAPEQDVEEESTIARSPDPLGCTPSSNSASGQVEDYLSRSRSTSPHRVPLPDADDGDTQSVSDESEAIAWRSDVRKFQAKIEALEKARAAKEAEVVEAT